MTEFVSNRGDKIVLREDRRAAAGAGVAGWGRAGGVKVSMKSRKFWSKNHVKNHANEKYNFRPRIMSMKSINLVQESCQLTRT